MSKDKFSDYDSTPGNNTDIGGIDIQGTAIVQNFDNALREFMAQTAKHYARATVASASTVNLGAQSAQYIEITGTTTITGLGTVKAGTLKFVRFAASLTLTHNATSLILPGSANITTAAGDVALFVSEGSGNWRCVGYHPAAAASIATQAEAEAGTSTNRLMTPQRTKQAVNALGGLIHIASGTASGAASINITGLSSSYRAYLLVFDDLRPSTSAVTLQLRTSTDNGATYNSGASDYAHARMQGTSAGSTGAAGSTGDSSITIVAAVSSTNGLEPSGQIWVYNPTSTDSRTNITAEISYLSSSAVMTRTSTSGQRLAAENNNAFQIFFSTGNITSANYTLYGLRA